MLRIGLISDTHSWLDPRLAKVFSECDMILHAGDIGSPEVLKELEEIAPTTAVKGNIDGGELRFLPLEVVLELEGFRIGIRHICGNPYRPNAATRAFIAREKLDILLAGHTHIPVVGRVGGALWINPGAAGREGHHDFSFAARLYLEQGEEIKMERVELGRRGEYAPPKKG